MDYTSADYAYYLGRKFRGVSIEVSMDSPGTARPLSGLFARCFEVAGAVFLCLTFSTSWLVWSLGGAELIGRIYLFANVCLYAAAIVDSRRGGVTLLVRFFFLFFIAIPALVQIDSGVFPWGSRYGAVELAAGYRILALAQIGLIAGSLIYSAREPREPAVPVSAPLRPHFYRVAMLVMTIVVAAAIPYLGSGALLEARFEIATSTEFEGLNLQILNICRSISLLSFLVWIYLWKNDRDCRRDPVFVMSSALTLVVFVAYFYPPALSRLMLLGAVVAISALFVDYFRVAVKIAFAVIAPLFLFILFPTVRLLGSGNVPDFAATLQRDLHAYMLRGDFDGFKQVVDTWIYIEKTGDWRLGENFLGVVLFWIPRLVWPDKPEKTGYLVTTSLGYPYTNVANPLPSEAYISWGLPGVIAMLVLAGWWIARLEYRARFAMMQPGLSREMLLYCITMGFVIIIFRGSIQGVISAFGGIFLTYWVLAWFHDRSPPRTNSVSQRAHFDM